MSVLRVPPTHSFPAVRLAFWAQFAALIFIEAYQDIETWNTPKRQFK